MNPTALNPTPQLEIVELTKVYHTRARKQVCAVDALNLTFKPGEIVGLLGANGAGKTTLIKMLCGLVLPTCGHVRVNGEDLLAQSQQIFRRVGVVLEGNRNIYWRLSIEENLRYFGALRGLSGKLLKQRVEDILTFIDLKAERRVLGKDLSRGMQQRVGIGLSLLHDPHILLLDEPMLGLDVPSARMLQVKLRELASQGRLVLLSTHLMHDAQQHCDSVVIMNKGRLVVHDSVSNLLHLFSTHLYAIRLGKPLDAGQLARLQTVSPYVVATETGLRVLATDPATLYHAFDVLKETCVPIVEVKEEVSLEDIFVALTQTKQLPGLPLADYWPLADAQPAAQLLARV